MSMQRNGLRMGGLCLLTAAVGLGTIVLPVPSKAASSAPLTVALIQKQGDQQYFVDEANGAKAEAKALGNVKVDVINVHLDSNAAISAVTTMLGQKVDGIAIVVPDQRIGPQVISAAEAAHVPLVAVDDPIKSGTGTPAPFVGFDSTEMGMKVGTEAGKLFKQSHWAAKSTRIVMPYKQDLSDCQLRAQGELDGFKAAAGSTPKVIRVGTDNSTVDAENRTSAVVTANPGVKHWVVMGCNDESETGSVTALQNASFTPDQIIGVGLGGYLTCKDWKAHQASGNKAALYISGRDVGSAAIRVLVAALRDHTPLPQKTIAKTTIVDSSSWQSVMGSCD